MDELDPIVVGKVKDKIHTFVLEQLKQTELSREGKQRTDRGYFLELYDLSKDIITYVKQHGQS